MNDVHLKIVDYQNLCEKVIYFKKRIHAKKELEKSLINIPTMENLNDIFSRYTLMATVLEQI